MRMVLSCVMLSAAKNPRGPRRSVGHRRFFAALSMTRRSHVFMACEGAFFNNSHVELAENLGGEAGGTGNAHALAAHAAVVLLEQVVLQIFFHCFL
jgi:hypothetical protein